MESNEFFNHVIDFSTEYKRLQEEITDWEIKVILGHYIGNLAQVLNAKYLLSKWKDYMLLEELKKYKIILDKILTDIQKDNELKNKLLATYKKDPGIELFLNNFKNLYSKDIKW